MKWECGKVPQFSCDSCDKKFFKKSCLRKHIKIVHDCSGQDLYGCPNVGCSKRYKNYCHLMFHLKNECGKQPQFSCPECDRKFSRKSNMNRHITAVHK